MDKQTQPRPNQTSSLGVNRKDSVQLAVRGGTDTKPIVKEAPSASELTRTSTVHKSNQKWKEQKERELRDRRFDLSTHIVKDKYRMMYKKKPNRGTCAYVVMVLKTGNEGGQCPGYSADSVQIFIAVLIFVNFIMNAIEAEVPTTEDPTALLIFKIFEYFFAIAFGIELAWNMGASFFCEFWCGDGWAWNWFDTVVVLVSIISLAFDGLDAISVLRLLRAFRVFRLFKRLPSLNRIVKALERSLPGVANAFVITMLIMSIAAILGVELLREVHPDGEKYFGNFALSLLSMFQIMTGESWSEAIARPVCRKNAMLCYLFFYVYILVVGFMMINVSIALLLEKFVEAEEDDDDDVYGEKENPIKMIRDELDDILNKNIIPLEERMEIILQFIKQRDVVREDTKGK